MKLAAKRSVPGFQGTITMDTITTVIIIIVNQCLVGSVMRMASVDKELHSAGTPADLIQTCAVAWTEYV